MKKLLGTAAAIAALSMSGAANAQLVVDLFSTPQATITDSTLADGGVFSQAGAGGDTTIIGGFRDLGVELKQQTGDTSASIGVSGGYLNFSTDTLAAATGLVRWDGATAATSIGDPTSFALAADLSLYTSFQLLTVFSDGLYNFSLELFTDADTWSKILLTATETNPAVLPDGVASFISIAAFLDCGGVATCGTDGAVDLTNVGAIQGIIDPTGSQVSLDLTLNQVTAIPEPASLSLLGLGLLGLGAMRRRTTK